MDNNILILLENINKRLDIIEEKINKLSNKQDEIQSSTSKMDHHIQFVENVYDKVKQPLLYATNKINILIGNTIEQQVELPIIDYHNNNN